MVLLSPGSILVPDTCVVAFWSDKVVDTTSLSTSSASSALYSNTSGENPGMNSTLTLSPDDRTADTESPDKLQSEEAVAGADMVTCPGTGATDIYTSPSVSSRTLVLLSMVMAEVPAFLAVKEILNVFPLPVSSIS